MIDRELAVNLLKGKPWHHDFDVLPGVRTNGTYNPEALWNQLQLPDDMSGMTFADVGASNGYFSFEARKRGAKVVAFDYRHKENSGFGLLQYINGMNDIEHHQVNVLEITPEKYGQFDIVLALGLLYHVSDPYYGLANCGLISRDRLYIESYCIDPLLPEEYASQPLMRFLPDPERFPDLGQPNADRSNFWGFTSVCLQRMVADVGFDVIKANTIGDRCFLEARRTLVEKRRTPSESETRLGIAYGHFEHVPVAAGNRDAAEAWCIY